MGFDFKPLLCFICRSCSQTFPDVDTLKTHKIECHLGECLKTKCIIFQEIVLGDEWTPPSVYTNRSGSHFAQKLISRGETSPPTPETTENFTGEQTLPFRNPCVSLKPLTSEELKSKTVSTEIRTGVGSSATRKRSVLIAEAATTVQKSRSSNLTSLVSERNEQKNTAVVALPPKRTKFIEEVDGTISVLNKESIKTETQIQVTEIETSEAAILTCGPVNVCSNTDRYNVSDIIKLEPESEEEIEVVPEIESQVYSRLWEDPNDSTEDFPANPTSNESQAEDGNWAADSFNDSSDFNDDDRPPTPDFSSLAEENTVLLPDNDTESQNQISPVNCIMCETQLVTAEEEKNHLDNCWLHNTSRHIYCVLCNIRFKYPMQLQKHQQRIHNEATNEFHSGTSLVPINLEDSYDEEDIDESAVVDTLPLGKWIPKRQQRLPDLILLHPDPTDPTCLVRNCTTLTCKLCKEQLQAEHLAKDHVKTCWAYNKDKHVYCHLCQKSFNWPGRLRHHNRMFHPFKSLPLPTIFCEVCHEEFQSFAELRKHEDSMTEFFQAMTAKESLFVKQKTKRIHLAAPSQRPINTSPPRIKIEKGRRPASAASTYVQIEANNPVNDAPSATNWHKFEQKNKQKNLVALENLILLEHSNVDILQSLITESSVMRCKLCLQLLGSKSHMKLHLENCWLHNKGRHIYCISCQTHFQHPRALKLHNLREHSEAGNESVTDLTTVDEAGSNSSVASDLLPLGQWIEMRRRDYGDIIQFDPDPSLKKNKNIIINGFKPVTCKLCKFIFKSTETVKGHAKICWFFNKHRHRLCEPCQLAYKDPSELQNHIQNHHLEIFPRPSFYCIECEQVFQTSEELKTHEESREEFFKGVRETAT